MRISTRATRCARPPAIRWPVASPKPDREAGPLALERHLPQRRNAIRHRRMRRQQVGPRIPHEGRSARPSGSAMHRCAVPRLTASVGASAASIFSSAARQRERIARQFGARRVGQILAPPRHHHRQRLTDDRRQHDGDEPRRPARTIGASAFVLVAAPAASAAAGACAGRGPSSRRSARSRPPSPRSRSSAGYRDCARGSARARPRPAALRG